MKDLVKRSRSNRRFYGDKEITIKQLHSLVELARLSSSGANLQPIKYILVCTKEINAKVYDTLGWAGYLKEWDGPIKSERPTAFIVILRDKTIRKELSLDDGICTQSIFLGANDIGLGGCIFTNIKRDKLKEILNIGEDLEISAVIALGYPKENVILTEIGEDRSIKYYRDEEGNHYVPKRSLQDLIVSEV